MRSLILVLILGSLSAAVESFTLDDGRRLVGTYDATTSLLTIDDKVAVKVRERQIVKREPVEDVAEVPAAPAAVAKPTKAAKPIVVADPRAQLAAIDARARKDSQAVLTSWLMSIDLTSPPIPDLGSDPRQSEVLARQQAIDEARPLEALRHLRQLVAGDPDGTNAATSIRGQLCQGTPSLLEWYCEHRAAP